MKKLSKVLLNILGCALLLTGCKESEQTSNKKFDDDIIPIEDVVVEPDNQEDEDLILKKTCQEIKAMGIKANGRELVCFEDFNETDYWANAAYKCAKEEKRLPSSSELKELADNLYGTDVSNTSTVLNINNSAIWNILGGKSIFIWVNSTSSAGTANFRKFYTGSTSTRSQVRSQNSFKAICTE